jgi:hypothetical protein
MSGVADRGLDALETWPKGNEINTLINQKAEN